MLKNLIRAALTGLVQRWVINVGSEAPHASAPIHLNSDAIRTSAIRIGSLLTLSFLNFLLFVGALVVTVVAVAHSFDVYDHFVATSVFWAGIIMGFTALVIGGLSGWALLHTKFALREFVIVEPDVEPAFSMKDRIFAPFLEGLAEGFRRARAPAESYDPRENPAA
jgi:hypothetical protein